MEGALFATYRSRLAATAMPAGDERGRCLRTSRLRRTRATHARKPVHPPPTTQTRRAAQIVGAKCTHVYCCPRCPTRWPSDELSTAVESRGNWPTRWPVSSRERRASCHLCALLDVVARYVSQGLGDRYVADTELSRHQHRPEAATLRRRGHGWRCVQSGS